MVSLSILLLLLYHWGRTRTRGAFFELKLQTTSYHSLFLHDYINCVNYCCLISQDLNITFALVLLLLPVAFIQITDGGRGQAKLSQIEKARVLYNYARLGENYCDLKGHYNHKESTGAINFTCPSHQSVKSWKQSFLKFGDLKDRRGGTRNARTKISPELIAEVRRLTNNGTIPTSARLVAKSPSVNVSAKTVRKIMKDHLKLRVYVQPRRQPVSTSAQQLPNRPRVRVAHCEFRPRNRENV